MFSARFPERLPALSWVPCGEGCLRLVEPWYVTSAEGETARMATRHIDGIPEELSVMTIGPLEGPPRAAFLLHEVRDDDCFLVGQASAEGHGAFAVDVLSDPRIPSHFFAGAVEDLREIEAPLHIFQPPEVEAMYGALIQSAVSSQLAVARTYNRRLFVFPGGAGPPEEIGHSCLGDVVVSGDHVLWADDPSGDLMHWTPETGTEVYLGGPDRHEFPQPGGRWISWVTLFDYDAQGRAQRAELWVSELARRPADLAPRLLHRDVIGRRASAAGGDGVFAWFVGEPGDLELHVIDFETGRESVLRDLPDGIRRCSWPVAVSRRELLLACTPEGDSEIEFTYLRLDPRRLSPM